MLTAYIDPNLIASTHLRQKFKVPFFFDANSIYHGGDRRSQGYGDEPYPHQRERNEIGFSSFRPK